MADNGAPGAWPILASGTRLAGFTKGITKHCYTQNMKGLGLMVSEKKIVMFSPIKAKDRIAQKIAIFQPSCIFETSKIKFDERMKSPLKYNCQDTLICPQPQI